MKGRYLPPFFVSETNSKETKKGGMVINYDVFKYTVFVLLPAGSAFGVLYHPKQNSA
jgi:hypothetical protein